MTTLPSASLSEESRSTEPAWLAHSLFVYKLKKDKTAREAGGHIRNHLYNACI